MGEQIALLQNVVRVVHDEADEVMLPIFHIKTDGVENFCQVLKHVIHVVVRWLILDSFKDFVPSSELRGDLHRFCHCGGVLVTAMGIRGHRQGLVRTTATLMTKNLTAPTTTDLTEKMSGSVYSQEYWIRARGRSMKMFVACC